MGGALYSGFRTGADRISSYMSPTMARRSQMRGACCALVACACSLVACRGVLGIDDGALLDAGDPDATESGSDAGLASTSDGTVITDARNNDPGAANDGAPHDGGCVTCADGGCKVDSDCADPIRQRCSNGMWSTAATFVCIPRDVWGTLHAELPTGTVDWSEQYYGDVTHQSGSTLIRVQIDKGYTVYSVTVADGAVTGAGTPFSPALTTGIFVNVADNALGASKGGWNGAGTLTLTAMGTAKGERIAGTFTGTLTQLGTNATAPFKGEIAVTVP